MVKSLSAMGITDSDFPMSSITGRANLLLTTSTGGGVYLHIKKSGSPLFLFSAPDVTGTEINLRPRYVSYRSCSHAVCSPRFRSDGGESPR
ncbi:hypothetical protein EHW66_14150 [Erwinia psidii]|uniref:Uncharacterized protein n=1 Tax=Erwinia psidii TaxID=69224 RepID=A0A3N6UV64_9GAMM|nr:hypothetical protein [Erwinia psidii]RQM36745.1 hypothetical protein EB241_18455 [Erwinia psidii]